MAEGRVIVNQRRQFLVEDNNGDRVRCIVKGRKLLPVAGDRVQWVALDDDVGLIQHIHDRRNTLCRYDVRRGKQPLAANLDQLLVVTASQPALDIFMLDKYLVAAAASGTSHLTSDDIPTPDPTNRALSLFVSKRENTSRTVFY